MNNFEEFFKKAEAYHGHACAGIALGTKTTLAALKKLGMEPGKKNKNLIVYVEVDRCMTDAVQSITGCTLGHRSLKLADYGKFAATFIDLNTGRAIRATIKESFDSSGPIEKLAAVLAEMPDEELVILQEVKVDIPKTDLPGSPSRKAYCSKCGERVMDGRDVQKDGETRCRSCAGASYYKVL